MVQRFDQIPKADSGSGPKVRSSAAVLRLKFIALFGSLVAAALCGVVAIVLTVSTGDPEPVELPDQPTATAYATVAADDFLNGRCTNVPVADRFDSCFGVTSSSAPEQPEVSDEQSFDREAVPVGRKSVDANGTEVLPVLSWDWSHFDRSYNPDFDVTYETHHFLVVTGPDNPGSDVNPPSSDRVGTRLWELSITFTLTDDGPVLSAAPSLIPVPPRSTTVPPLDWVFYDEQAPAAVQDRVKEWAAAYASDDSAAMAAIADDKEGRSYLGLGDAEVTGADFSGGAIKGADDTMAIRARVSFRRANGFTWTTEFDLLVHQASTAQPKVVAWGPPGSAMSLRAFMNSVESR